MINGEKEYRKGSRSRYMDYGDFPSRYLIEKGKALIIERYCVSDNSNEGKINSR
jgi:hypothetical protein